MTDDEVVRLAQQSFDQVDSIVEVLSLAALSDSRVTEERRFDVGQFTVMVLSTSNRAHFERIDGDVEVRLVRVRRREMTRDEWSLFYERVAEGCMQRIEQLRKGEAI